MAKHEQQKRFKNLLKVTLDGLRDNLERHMPPGPYRDFYSWSLSTRNPELHTFLEVMGIVQLVKLTTVLLDGLVTDDEWDALVDHTVLLNAYFQYEIVSDNLAIGLGGVVQSDHTHHLQHKLLYMFNRSMMSRLEGDPRPASQLLTHFRESGRAVSLFNQSLNQQKHQRCIQAYLADQSCDQTRNDGYGGCFKDAVWATLVANIETGVELAGTLDGYHTASLLRDGFIQRYAAVNHLLDGRELSLENLAHLGAQTILVIPTLAYYAGLLGERVRPNPRYKKIVDDKSLYSVLYSAAQVIRLLNDLGTNMATLTGDQQQMVSEILLVIYEEQLASGHTMIEFLEKFVGNNVLFTRIHKDIVYREFNVALYRLGNDPVSPQNLNNLAHTLAFFASHYAKHYNHLEQQLPRIAEQLKDDTISQLIMRFVQFHLMLYSEEFRTQAGEYAI